MARRVANLETLSDIALEELLTVQDVERIAREFIQVWSVGNLDVVDRLASEDLEVKYSHFPEAIVGRQAFRSTLEETFRHFPDLETTARTIVADGEQAAVEWQYQGTHQHGELLGFSRVVSKYGCWG